MKINGDEDSPQSCSFLRTPGVLSVEPRLLALRHFDADSLVTEWSDSASVAAGFPALAVAPTSLASPDAALRITAASGVGRARRRGPLEVGVAAGGERGGDGGREGRGGSMTLKVLESQESFT